MDPAQLNFWALAILAALAIGLSKGGLPAIGMLGTPILALQINAVTAAGLLLPVFVVSDIFGLIAYRRAFSRRLLAILVPATAIGVVLGYMTASQVADWVITLLIGLIGLLFALNLLLRRAGDGTPRPISVPKGIFWGTIAGYTSFISHAGAPPYQVYTLPLKLEKMVFAGTTTILFAWVNAIKLIPYYALGQLNPANLKVSAALLLPAALAVYAGVKLVKVLPEKLFYQVVTWALLLISIKLLIDGYLDYRVSA